MENSGAVVSVICLYLPSVYILFIIYSFFDTRLVKKRLTGTEGVLRLKQHFRNFLVCVITSYVTVCLITRHIICFV